MTTETNDRLLVAFLNLPADELNAIRDAYYKASDGLLELSRLMKTANVPKGFELTFAHEMRKISNANQEFMRSKLGQIL